MTNATTSIATLNGGTPRPNKVKCPACGSKMVDSSPNLILTSNPAQLNVNCTKCNYKGYRRI